METPEEERVSLFDLSFNDEAKDNLKQAGKWARLTSILICSFVLIYGLSLVFFISHLIDVIKGYFFYNANFGDESIFGEVETKIRKTLWIVFLTITGIFLFYYSFYFLFGNYVVRGIKRNNIQKIETGLKWLKIFVIVATFISCVILVAMIVKFYLNLNHKSLL